MAEDQNDAAAEVAEVEAEVETLEEASADEQDTTDWKAKFDEVSGRLKRAETKLEKSKIDTKVEQKLKEKTGELDETQLDYFDLKGYSDSEEVDIFHKIMLKTGMSAREVLKDDYALSKVKSLREAKEVQAATPSSTKRGSTGPSSDVAAAVAKFESSGVMPEDFKLASAVVDALATKTNRNQPSWHK